MNTRYGISANGRHSFRDFGLCVKAKEIGLPAKTLNRRTVPYANGSWDFSTLGGDPVWGDREIAYTFDILEDSEQAMNRKRDAVLNWLANIHEANLYDDAMPGYHFVGSYAGGDISDDVEASELTAKFVCYPFRVADLESRFPLRNGENILEYEGQATAAYILADAAGSVTIGGLTQGFSANIRTELPDTLSHGANAIALVCSGSACLYYTEEII